MSNSLATNNGVAGNTTANRMDPATGAAGYGGGGNKYANMSNDPAFAAEPGFPVYNRRIANPGPLGMYAFSVSLILWGLYIVHAHGVQETSFMVGLSLAVGGLVQLLAGMWAFATGNTFAATMFSMYGGFWLAIGILYVPSSGGITAYGTATPDVWTAGGAYGFHAAVGFFHMVWFLFTFMLWLASFRSSITLVSTLFFTWMAFLLFMIGEFTGKYLVIKGGGGLFIVAGAIAMLHATAALMTHETSYFPMHRGLGELNKRSANTAY
jgi:succinate-acetate transporter protein